MKSIIFVPIKDYFMSRKRVFIKFLIPMLIAVTALLLTIFFNIGNSEKVVLTFSEFIATQINIVAILLSNIAYNVIIEIIYLVGLITISLVENLLPIVSLKYLTAICIFIILHILLVLLESVAQMYLTFWADKK